MTDQNQEKHISLKDLQETVAIKKREAAEIKTQSASLAAENNLPEQVDPDAMPKGEKTLAAIGYLSFLCILPLVLKPDSALCQFHGKQALLMLAFFIFFGWIVAVFFQIILGWYLLAHNLVIIMHFGFALYGAYGAFNGKMTKVPIFGDFIKYLDW